MPPILSPRPHDHKKRFSFYDLAALLSNRARGGAEEVGKAQAIVRSADLLDGVTGVRTKCRRASC
jgi:hypothetical protein